MPTELQIQDMVARAADAVGMLTVEKLNSTSGQLPDESVQVGENLVTNELFIRLLLAGLKEYQPAFKRDPEVEAQLNSVTGKKDKVIHAVSKLKGHKGTFQVYMTGKIYGRNVPVKAMVEAVRKIMAEGVSPDTGLTDAPG